MLVVGVAAVLGVVLEEVVVVVVLVVLLVLTWSLTLSVKVHKNMYTLITVFSVKS